MNATVLDDQRVTGIPVDPPSVMYVVSLAFQNVENGTVHVAVFLPVTTRRINVDVSFDRLCNLHGLRIDHFLAEVLRTAFPFHVTRVIDPGLREELLFQFPVSTFQSTYESPLLRPSLPGNLFGTFLGRFIQCNDSSRSVWHDACPDYSLRIERPAVYLRARRPRSREKRFQL